MKKGQSDWYSPAAIEVTLEAFFKQARRQFGKALKKPPGFTTAIYARLAAGSNPAVNVRNREAISLYAFIFRERGVLIG